MNTGPQGSPATVTMGNYIRGNNVCVYVCVYVCVCACVCVCVFVSESL